MPVHVAFVTLRQAPLAALVAALEKQVRGGFAVVRPELAALPRLVEYGYLSAFKRFENGTATANNLNMEWLCRIAGDAHVKTALAFCKPASSIAAIATLEPFDISALSRAGLADPLSPTDAQLADWRRDAARLFKFSSAALEQYTVEELAIAQSAASGA
jgi:tRNA threonylcarbamoyladenosine modification (KEOPS) complex Cgi121 subunit